MTGNENQIVQLLKQSVPSMNWILTAGVLQPEQIMQIIIGGSPILIIITWPPNQGGGHVVTIVGDRALWTGGPNYTWQFLISDPDADGQAWLSYDNVLHYQGGNIQPGTWVASIYASGKELDMID